MSLIIVVQAGEVADCWFRSRVHSRPVVLIRGTVIVLGAGVKLLLVGLGAGLVAFAWVYAVEAAAFVAGLVIYSRLGPNPPPAWRFEASLAGKLVREGAGFALAGFLGGLALRIDQIAVSAILGDADSGLYYGALRIMEIPVFVATTTAASLFPALAIAESDPLMHERLETVFGIMSVLAWATAIGTTIAGPWLIPLLLGPSYAGAWPALVIQAWASLFLFSGMIRTNYLALRSAPGAQIGIASLTLAGQVVLNMALVPRFGISGAAASFLLAQAINAWLLPFGFASLRPCLGPQFRSVLSPFSPARWREFVAIVRGDITKAQTQ
jgi:O-antigen/teichoic acid export membrane protein